MALPKDRFDSGDKMSECTKERPATLSTLVSHNTRELEEFEISTFPDEREQFVEAPACRNRAGRGVLTGVLLGAGIWTVILASLGVIRL